MPALNLADRHSPAEANPHQMKIIAPVLLLAAAVASCGMPDSVEEAGTPFPEFKLQAHDGSTVSKSDLLGRTSVIWFYPKASTPG